MKVCIQCQAKLGGNDWNCPSCGYKAKKINGRVSLLQEENKEAKSFDKDLFIKLAEIESDNFWFQTRNSLIKWAISRYFGEVSSFLEIGCGTGYVLSSIEKSYPHISMYGSELYAEGLDIAAKRLGRAQLFQMDAKRIPFEEEFDLIGAFDVIEHIDDDELVLVQINKALRSGGGIIITVPQHNFLWSSVDEHSFHLRRYSSKDLINKVKQAGFKIEFVSSFVTLLLPFILLSRLKWRSAKIKNSEDILNDMRINSVLNNSFKTISSIERFLIRIGIRLPAGGSLLLVGRKE